MANWGKADAELDDIIKIASSLKGSVGGVKGQIDLILKEKEASVQKVHLDIEALQQKLDHTSISNREERERLERQIAQKEEEQAAKVRDMDARIHANLEANARAEREREAARGDAESEKRRLTALLADLEEDAANYNRLRPARSTLSQEDVAIIRNLFLSSAASAGGKLSFADLKQIMVKYSNTMPEGALKKLFELVENDTKGRMSYVTMVAVANDLAVLVADFRKIDTNNSNTLSRKEFREHFSKLGFQKKSVIDALFRYADEDESDEVGFSEYIHLSLCLLVLRILYTFADYDKSGQLSKDEVRRVLSEAAVNSAALGKFDQFFTVVDVDNSGTLDYAEFVMLVLFMFCDGEGIAPPAPGSKHPIVGNLYFIESTLNGKAVDVQGAGPRGSAVVMFSKKPNGNANQVWRWTAEGFVEPLHQNRTSLDIRGGGGAGAGICIWDFKPMHQAANQLWRYDAGTQQVVNVGSGLVLEVANNDTNDTAPLIANTPSGSQGQRFTLSPATLN
eukprot:TRINITY_DN40_c0_g2_i1.p1 TRINITY_DN40_c0_g2~~TRINITY_DN40_c0_g2_i1.p1  ORF type:complete len:508 (-),score=164.84 TRINITY_DN40_c0_g2_i1:45-1568(-)